MLDNEIIKKMMKLPEDPEREKIESTARELEMLSFSPLLLIDTPNLLYMTRQEVINEAERIAALPQEQLPSFDRDSITDTEDFKQKQLSMLYFNYELLTRLRADVPEAWDYIHELYEDD